jgi:hypothetical protein
MTSGLNDWEHRVAYARFWEEEYKNMEPHLDYLGPASRELFNNMREWPFRMDEMLGLLSNKLGPVDSTKSSKTTSQGCARCYRAVADSGANATTALLAGFELTAGPPCKTFPNSFLAGKSELIGPRWTAQRGGRWPDRGKYPLKSRIRQLPIFSGRMGMFAIAPSSKF